MAIGDCTVAVTDDTRPRFILTPQPGWWVTSMGGATEDGLLDQVAHGTHDPPASLRCQDEPRVGCQL